jgi:transcriptional regulator with GAF, ATPase, and Fis domain
MGEGAYDRLHALARALILDTFRKNPELAERFVLQTADGRTDVNVGSALVVAMLRASYDGNVRDIRNLLSRAMTETHDPPLMPPSDLRAWNTPPTMPPPARDVPAPDDDVDDLLGGMDPEARRIHDTLERVGWHKQRAAEALGITRHQLDRLMKKLGIERPK